MSSATAATSTSAPAGQAAAATIISSDTTSTQPASGAASVGTPAAQPDATPKPPAPAAAVEPPKPADSTKVEAAKPADLVIKLPNGAKVDEATLSEFKALATKHNLSSEVASELAAWDLARHDNAIETDTAAWKARGEQWAEEAKKNPAELQDFLKGIRKYGGSATAADSNELTDALNELGIFYHPAIRSAFSRVGAAHKEDSSATGGSGASNAKPSALDRLKAAYPSMFAADGTQKL